MESAIESAFERAQDRTREPGTIVLIAGHELRACQRDSRGAGNLIASIDGVEMLASDHHTDALAYRVRLYELGELLDFDGAVARGCVGECSDSIGGHLAAHDARARFGFGGSHGRKMIRQPGFHPDEETGEFADGVELAPAEALPMPDAFALFTTEAARLSRLDAGVIAVDRVADLIVLPRDPFALKPADLMNVTVDITIVGGRVVYERGRPATASSDSADLRSS